MDENLKAELAETRAELEKLRAEHNELATDVRDFFGALRNVDTVKMPKGLATVIQKIQMRTQMNARIEAIKANKNPDA
jgi:glutamine amidotransferase PdxT